MELACPFVSCAFSNVWILLQPAPYYLIELFADWLAPDPIDNLSGEGVDQHATRGFKANPARAKIEDRFIVQLPHGRAMGALDIVGIDFQLRFGIDGGVVRKEEVLIGLFSVGFLGLLLDENASMKHAPGAVVEDAIEILVAVAMRFGVLDDHVVVGQLVVLGELEAVQDAVDGFDV